MATSIAGPDKRAVTAGSAEDDPAAHEHQSPRSREQPRSKGGRPRADATLTPEDIRIVDLFIERGSKVAVARELGISENKVSAHLDFPLVRQELAKRIEELRGLCRAKLVSLAGAAFEALEALLEDPNPAIRLKAATYIVDRLLALPDSVAVPAVPGMETRLTQLAERLSGEGDNA